MLWKLFWLFVSSQVWLSRMRIIIMTQGEFAWKIFQILENTPGTIFWKIHQEQYLMGFPVRIALAPCMGGNFQLINVCLLEQPHHIQLLIPSIIISFIKIYFRNFDFFLRSFGYPFFIRSLICLNTASQTCG